MSPADIKQIEDTTLSQITEPKDKSKMNQADNAEIEAEFINNSGREKVLWTIPLVSKTTKKLGYLMRGLHYGRLITRSKNFKMPGFLQDFQTSF